MSKLHIRILFLFLQNEVLCCTTLVNCAAVILRPHIKLSPALLECEYPLTCIPSPLLKSFFASLSIKLSVLKP